MKNLTQKKWVKSQLKEKGFITRNECLRNYISRLGSIICDLKKEGYDITGDYIKTEYGKDFSYKLTPNQNNLYDYLEKQ